MDQRRLHVLAALALVALVARWAQGARADCASQRQVALSLAFATNRTGHPQLQARLEQPSENGAWQLEVELETSLCEAGLRRNVLALTLNGSPWSKVIPAGYTLVEGLGYYRKPGLAMNWTDARDFCARDGAMLAVPATQNEIDTLQQKFPISVVDTNDRSETWIGVSDRDVERVWKTLTGVLLQEATNLTWVSSEPNGGKGEDCVVYTNARGLHDRQCYFKYAFFCKGYF